MLHVPMRARFAAVDKDVDVFVGSVLKLVEITPDIVGAGWRPVFACTGSSAEDGLGSGVCDLSKPIC